MSLSAWLVASLVVSGGPQAEAASSGGGDAARTQAVELRVEGVQRVRELAGRQARPGYEFVIVTTSWKNVIPLRPVDKKAAAAGSNPVGGLGGFGTQKPSSAPADVTMEPTPYVVPELTNHLWLLTNDRFADPVHLAIQDSVPDHLPKRGFTVPALDAIVRGTLVFEAPEGPAYQALQFFDKTYGHALVTVAGERAATPAGTKGPTRENELLQASLTEVRALDDKGAGEGSRRYLVGIRGQSRSPNDLVALPMAFIFAQTDRGCLASPDRDSSGLTRPFGDVATFLPGAANEGQLSFVVPADTRAVRVLIRARNAGPLDLSAGDAADPAWPTPVHTITDGSTLRLHVLPTPTPPPNLPPPRDGRAYQLLDVVAENLKPRSGLELQAVQLRLKAADGAFIEPSPLSASVPCRLPSDGVIPPATARRFVFVYDVPGDQPTRRLEYRGFEVDAVAVDLP